MRELIINGTTINDQSDCYVTAEIGNNHQGKLETAKEMFRIAKLCGANAVKLQKRCNRALYTKELYNKPYDTINSYGKTYGEHREKLEFEKNEYMELMRYAEEIDVDFICTAFDFPSVDFLEDIGISVYKIASGDLKTIPLIKYIAETGKPMFLSTGGGTTDDAQRAYDAIMPINNQLCIMQSTASYPCEPEDMNLNVITTYRNHFPDTVIGLSDHQNGIAMSLVAYVLGSRVFEKHFTLNRGWLGTDHGFSLEPPGLEKMIRDLKRARIALGDEAKKPLPCETAPIYKMGKKLVAAHDIRRSQVICRDDIAIKSPGDGLSPHEIENIIGKVTKRELKEDENIDFNDIT
jgi:sialic acid synthase